jgi:hypothetical protein
VATCFLMALFAWGTGFYAHGIYLIEIRSTPAGRPRSSRRS